MSAESGSPSGWIDYFGQAIRTSVNYLPSQVSEVLTQSRDYAVAKLPVSGVRNVCAIATYVCDCCLTALKLLVGHQEEYLACMKLNDDVLQSINQNLFSK